MALKSADCFREGSAFWVANHDEIDVAGNILLVPSKRAEKIGPLYSVNAREGFSQERCGSDAFFDDAPDFRK